MQLEQLWQLVVETLADMKARDVNVIDVRGKTAITDYMVVASAPPIGTSRRSPRRLPFARRKRARRRWGPRESPRANGRWWT